MGVRSEFSHAIPNSFLSKSVDGTMIAIRNARSTDAEHLALIGLRAWESAILGWGENLLELRPNAYRAYVEFTAAHWDKITMAVVKRRPVGWGARANLNNQITDLWVDPEHHRTGIGKMLLAALERDIRRVGYDDVFLETHVRNAGAITFYKHCGYRVVSISVSFSHSLQRDFEKATLQKTFNDAENTL